MMSVTELIEVDRRWEQPAGAAGGGTRTSNGLVRQMLVRSATMSDGTVGVGHPAEILLVEDNPADAELAMIGLSDGNLVNNVQCVGDAESAVDYLDGVGPFAEVAKPDVILLDLNLPGMSGQEFLQVVKADERHRRIPVIVLTTSSLHTDVADAYGSLANAYIVKPVDFESFQSLMSQFREFWFKMVCLPTGGATTAVTGEAPSAGGLTEVGWPAVGSGRRRPTR